MEFHGGLGMFADVLSAVTLSTNGRMTGAFLASVAPVGKRRASRTGFPYSLFLERTGPGREEWFGPFEDDITHAYQYGSSASPGTALVVPTLLYTKESTSKSGMRSNYNHERAVPLQRMFPESAKVGVRKSKSNGQGGARVFHTMLNTAIRTPMIITDRDLYTQVTAFLNGLGRVRGRAPAGPPRPRQPPRRPLGPVAVRQVLTAGLANSYGNRNSGGDSCRVAGLSKRWNATRKPLSTSTVACSTGRSLRDGVEEPGRAFQAVRRAIADGYRLPAADAIQAEEERLDMLVAFNAVLLPGITSRRSSGKVALHPVTGDPLLDDGPVIQAGLALLRVSESRRKLLGLDKPIRHEVRTVDAIDAELEQLAVQVAGVAAGSAAPLPEPA